MCVFNWVTVCVSFTLIPPLCRVPCRAVQPIVLWTQAAWMNESQGRWPSKEMMFWHVTVCCELKWILLLIQCIPSFPFSFCVYVYMCVMHWWCFHVVSLHLAVCGNYNYVWVGVGGRGRWVYACPGQSFQLYAWWWSNHAGLQYNFIETSGHIYRRVTVTEGSQVHTESTAASIMSCDHVYGRLTLQACRDIREPCMCTGRRCACQWINRQHLIVSSVHCVAHRTYIQSNCNYELYSRPSLIRTGLISERANLNPH